MANIKKISQFLLKDYKKIAGVQGGCSKKVGGVPTLLPSGLNNLVLWLKVDALSGLNDGDLITNLADFSGNGFDASQGSDGSRPTYKTNIQNGLPVARFAGSQGRQLAAAPSLAESSFDLATYTIFAVAKRNSGSTIIAKNTLSFGTTSGRRRKIQLFLNATTFGLQNGSDTDVVGASATTSNMNNLAVIARADNDHDLIVNGVVTNRTTAIADSEFNDARVEIGQAFANGAERLNGDIAEVIVYSGAKTTDEVNAIKSYLASKYGIVTS